MDLAEIRNKINDIDDKLIKLLNERMICSKEVAQEKLETKECIYKPAREEEICNRFEAEAGNAGKMVIKSVMRNSRFMQYEMFVENGNVNSDFVKSIDDDNREVFSNGGKLVLMLEADETGAKGLTTEDILMLSAESGLEIKNVGFYKKTIELEILVDDTDESKKNAYILAYMLYMETIH